MIEISKYVEINKGAIVGKFDVTIPKWGGFYIREILLMQKDQDRWITFPIKKYESNGETKYFKYNGFQEEKMFKIFQEEVIKALDKYFNVKK